MPPITEDRCYQVTDLPTGRYALRTVIDPARLLTDANPANIEVTVYVELSANAARKVSKP